MIEGHGSDLYRYGHRIIADFSSNVWPEGTNQLVLEHLKGKLEIIRHYPEPNAESLTNNIANFLSLSPSNILVTNGSAEAFYLIAQLYKKSKSLVIIPSFAEYEDACVAHEHQVEYTLHGNLSNQIDGSTNLVWIGNPNNPNGTIIPNTTILKLCKKHPDKVFIVDEAYSQLSLNICSLLSYADHFENLIVIRSFTKIFTIPGIRLGYIAAHERIINDITKYKIPWSVNSLAIEVGNYIIDNYPKLLPNKVKLINESKNLQEEFSNIPGVEVYRSECNFFLVRLKKGSAKDLKEFLVKEYGLLIRDASNFKGLDESYFRIAVQDYEHNKLLVQGVKQWMTTIDE